MTAIIAKYDTKTFEVGYESLTNPLYVKFSFDWNVYDTDGSVAYCGTVYAETLHGAECRAWLEIEQSDWYKFGHGHVRDDYTGKWCVDWDCKQCLFTGRGNF